MRTKFNPGDIISSSDNKLEDMNEQFYLVESISKREILVSGGSVCEYILLNLATGKQEQCGKTYIERYYHQVA